jgi:hypothetical protein
MMAARREEHSLKQTPLIRVRAVHLTVRPGRRMSRRS